jgi:acyl dehydratase
MSGATDAFDPRTHHVVPPRAFTDFRIGEAFNLPSRTVTDANFAAFQVVSGDNHPIHYDVEAGGRAIRACSPTACRCCASAPPAPACFPM